MSTKPHRLGLHIPAKLWANVTRVAAEHETSIAALVREALRERLAAEQRATAEREDADA